MLIQGLIRGFAIDRKRLLLRRTPLVITQPTVAKKVAAPITVTTVVKQGAPKIIERKSVGSGRKSAGTRKTVTSKPRSNSSSSTTKKSQTSKKSSTSTSVSTGTSGAGWTGCEEGAGYVYQPPVTYSGGGCSLNKY